MELWHGFAGATILLSHGIYLHGWCSFSLLRHLPFFFSPRASSPPQPTPFSLCLPYSPLSSANVLLPFCFSSYFKIHFPQTSSRSRFLLFTASLSLSFYLSSFLPFTLLPSYPSVLLLISTTLLSPYTDVLILILFPPFIPLLICFQG